MIYKLSLCIIYTQMYKTTFKYLCTVYIKQMKILLYHIKLTCGMCIFSFADLKITYM